MYNKTFNIQIDSEQNNLILDFKTKYYEETEKNRRLEEEIKNLNEKINQIKNIIG